MRRTIAVLVLASTLVGVGASVASAVPVDPNVQVGDVVASGRDAKDLVRWRIVKRTWQAFHLELRATDSVRRGYSCFIDDPRTAEFEFGEDGQPIPGTDRADRSDFLGFSTGGRSRLHRQWSVEADRPTWQGRYDLGVMVYESGVGTTATWDVTCRARPGNWDGLAWFLAIRDGGAA